MAKNENLTLYKHYFDVEEKKVRVCSWSPNDGPRPNIPQSMMGTLMFDGGQKCRYVMYLTEENPQFYIETLLQKQQSKLKEYENRVQVERDYLNVLKMASADYRYRNGDKCECSHCGKPFVFDEFACAVYMGKPVCSDCSETYYGNCYGCGESFKFSEMNGDYLCKECQKGGDLNVC